MKYRKKPVVVEAMQYSGKNELQLIAWIGPNYITASTHPDGFMITTLEGSMLARPGDWIIRGVKGEYYPCKPDIFAATYEPAE